MWKKLTERHMRDATRAVYVNTTRLTRMCTIPEGTRLWCAEGGMIDVLETPEYILDYDETILITDKDKTDGGSRNENGRVSNPAVKPDR